MVINEQADRKFLPISSIALLDNHIISLSSYELTVPYDVWYGI